jgi:uncharacterized protein (DUF983 family)
MTLTEHVMSAGWLGALGRGFRRVCPCCGRGAMFTGYLAVRKDCGACGLAFDPLKADDAPAYFTIFIVGHVIVAGLLLAEKTAHPALWLQTAVWIPLAILMTFGLLPFVKGAVMGAIYASHAGGRRHPAE